MRVDCPLCQAEGGALVWCDQRLRVIHAQEVGFPAFYRVVWQAHVPEFSDLPEVDRAHCMQAVARVEQVLRAQLQPTKVNLAALGNQVPHLHWHVIARFEWDSHFPAPVWGAVARVPDPERLAALVAQQPQVHAALRQQLEQWSKSAA